jgi:hypothetical protein
LKRVRGIYRISNSAEQKSYIGSSADVGKRLGNHLNDLLNGEHGNHLLSAAWIRHGAATFAFHLVEELKQGDLLEREAHHIRLLRTYPNGYNHSSDGVGRKKVTAAELSEMKQRGAFDPVFRPYTAAPQTTSPAVTQPIPRQAATPSPKGGSGCLIMMAFAIVIGATMTFAVSGKLRRSPAEPKTTTTSLVRSTTGFVFFRTKDAQTSSEWETRINQN